MFPSLVTDIGKLKDAAATTGWESPQYRVFDDPATARLALRELQEKYVDVVVDIEVGIDKDNDYDHPDRYQMLCIGFSYAPGKAIVLGENSLRDRGVLSDLRRLLETKRWIAHNGKFDLAGLWSYGHGRLDFDTMLASYVVDERPGVHGLKYLATEVLGAPQYDLELKKYVGKGESYANVPRELLYKYNAYDVVCTMALRDYYHERMQREDLSGLHRFLVNASNALMPLELEGIQVDVDYLNELTVTYTDVLDELEGGLRELTEDHTFNPRSPQQVKAWLESVGIKVASTDASTLADLRERGKEVDFMDTLLEYRRQQKLYGTYIKGARKRLYRERLHPTFLLHGTVSGRLACRNPNLQNVPRESTIRRLFVPSDGNVFVQGDYAQAELRVMATLAQDEYLRGVFNEGRDIHSEVAERFFGSGFTKEQRVRAKAVVFGLAYGREAYSLAQEFDIPVNEAQRYLDSFFEVIPDLVEWRRGVQDLVANSHEDLVSPFGRHRRFWLITNDNKKDILKESLAFLPQSTASDICLSSLMALSDSLPDEARIRLPVHDSILVECPTEMAKDVAQHMQETMERTAVEVFSDYVHFDVDMKIGNSWGEL